MLVTGTPIFRSQALKGPLSLALTPIAVILVGIPKILGEVYKFHILLLTSDLNTSQIVENVQQSLGTVVGEMVRK